MAVNESVTLAASSYGTVWLTAVADGQAVSVGNASSIHALPSGTTCYWYSFTINDNSSYNCLNFTIPDNFSGVSMQAYFSNGSSGVFDINYRDYVSVDHSSEVSIPVVGFTGVIDVFVDGVSGVDGKYVPASIDRDLQTGVKYDGLYTESTWKNYGFTTCKQDGVLNGWNGFRVLNRIGSSDTWLRYSMNAPKDVFFYKGYEYDIVFHSNNFSPYYMSMTYNDLGLTPNDDTFVFTKLSDSVFKIKLIPSVNMLVQDVTFHANSSIPVNSFATFFVYDVTSNFIPVADSGSQGQTTAANTTVIKNVVTNISNTVSNISNQISNITNTITNTTNQIKDAVNQSADKVSQTVTNTSNQIKDSVNHSAEKITQTVTDKVNETKDTINTVGQKTQEKIDDTKKAVVDKLEDTKKGIISGIIDGLKSLFIPSDDFFKTWFGDMYSFFNDRLGFLMLPVDLLVKLIDMVVSADSSNAGIPFPEITWEGTVLIPAQTVKIEIFDTDFGRELQEKLYFVGNVIMIGALLSLMHRKIEEVLRS